MMFRIVILIALLLTDVCLSDYQQEALDVHNKFRAVHGSQPMTLNEEMSVEAAKYAQKLAKLGRLVTPSDKELHGMGDNLAMVCPTKSQTPATRAVTYWYNDVCKPGYDFSIGRGQAGTGEFTQVVWNASTELGFGKADVKKWGFMCSYIVAYYNPMGNFYTGNDDYKKNVKKGKFDRKAYCGSL